MFNLIIVGMLAVAGVTITLLVKPAPAKDDAREESNHVSASDRKTTKAQAKEIERKLNELS